MHPLLNVAATSRRITPQGAGARQLGDSRNSNRNLKLPCNLSSVVWQFALTALAGIRVHTQPCPSVSLSAPNGRTAATGRQGAARLANAAPGHALPRPSRCSTPALGPPPRQRPPKLTMSAWAVRSRDGELFFSMVRNLSGHGMCFFSYFGVRMQQDPFAAPDVACHMKRARPQPLRPAWCSIC